MKFIQNKLRKRMKTRGLSIVEVVKRMNAIQFQTDPTKRKMTRNVIYHTLANHTPSPDKIYMFSAVLEVRPEKLFIPFVDEEKLKTYQEIAKSLK